MEVKINQGSEMLDATIEIVDGVMVVSPKVEKFEPKDGDVVAYMNGDKATIYVFAGGYKYNTSFYVAYSGLRNEVFKTQKCSLDMNRDDIRPATEEEKKLLFDKLKEEGYEWDAEKKELIKLKWKPEVAGIYYYPSIKPQKGRIISYPKKERNTELHFDKEIIDTGWVFKTNKERQEFCNRLNSCILSIKP